MTWPCGSKLVPVTLPSPVADQLVACVGEALRNVERHAGTGQAEVTVTGGAGWAVVKITDRGRGFDSAATPPSRRGIRESITVRMLAAGGRAAIASRPGAGTTVTVSWPWHDRRAADGDDVRPLSAGLHHRCGLPGRGLAPRRSGRAAAA